MGSSSTIHTIQNFLEVLKLLIKFKPMLNEKSHMAKPRLISITKKVEKELKSVKSYWELNKEKAKQVKEYPMIVRSFKPLVSEEMEVLIEFVIKEKQAELPKPE